MKSLTFVLETTNYEVDFICMHDKHKFSQCLRQLKTYTLCLGIALAFCLTISAFIQVIGKRTK